MSLIALLVGAAILPQAASAWFLNLANARAARAASLPPDAPPRAAALAETAAHLTRAREFSNLPRLPLAHARWLLAQGEPARVAPVLGTADALQSDFITQFIWGDAEWHVQRLQSAYAHWRAAGAIVYFMRQAHRAIDAQQWQDAAHYARIAVGIDPTLADAHYVLGDALSHLNVNDPEARRELERAHALTRDNEFLSTILSRQGEVFAAQGKLHDALDRFNQARAVAPIDARPRTGYALTLLQLQPDAYTQAVALLTQVVDDSPWYTAAYIALANLAEARGDVPDAEQWLHKGLARNPNDARLLFPLGEFYARQGRRDEAKTTLTLALQYETRAEARQAIARALAELDAR